MYAGVGPTASPGWVSSLLCVPCVFGSRNDNSRSKRLAYPNEPGPFSPCNPFRLQDVNPSPLTIHNQYLYAAAASASASPSASTVQCIRCHVLCSVPTCCMVCAWMDRALLRPSVSPRPMVVKKYHRRSSSVSDIIKLCVYCTFVHWLPTLHSIWSLISDVHVRPLAADRCAMTCKTPAAA